MVPENPLDRWVNTSPLTVTQVAAEIGVHRVTLHKYMAGTVMPRPGVARKIERLTKGAVTIPDLLRAARS